MKYKVFFFLICFSFKVVGQQKLTLKEAEQQLQKNNLLLIAEQYNIDATKAAVIQAKIWEQPYLSLDFNALNPQANKIFDIGNQGQKGVAIQQLLYLGGKKKNEVGFAKSYAVIAEMQFEQLLRNLKYQLVQTFYTLYFDQNKLITLNKQIEILDELLKNHNIQAQKGNIPLKDAARLQSLVLGLINEKTNLINAIAETQQNLSLLTGSIDNIEPVVEEEKIINRSNDVFVSKEEIIALALENNLDYLLQLKVSESQELNLKWQKSLAVPDILTGLAYDQRGGAFNNQVNFTVGIPLPLWNKNKGNIKIAEAELAQFKTSADYKKMELQTKAKGLYNIWLQQKEQWKSIDFFVTSNINIVYEGMVANFQKRNITLLEFTDFMESYNQTSIQINEIKKALVQSSMSINYITNKEIF
jgi:cobalt-zinc-cadmium efflux system outer membrane protein